MLFFARKTLQNLIDWLCKRQEHALCCTTFLDSLNRFVKCNCLAKQANISRRVSKLTFWALALRQSTWTNCGLCVCSNVEDGATLLVWIWWRENKTHYSSLGWFIWTQHNVQLPVGLLAQLVERCTGIAEVMGSNPVRAWIFQVLIQLLVQ